MIAGVILAGGVGARMSAGELPKQYMELNNKPILMYSLEKFLRCNRIDCVFIGVHADWKAYTEDLICQYVPQERHRIFLVYGGKDRNETLQNVISAIEMHFPAGEDDLIVTHDAARPFLTMRMIEENIDCAVKYGAVNTVVPAVDTIVISEDGRQISDIPNRAAMYYGQSPQTFRVRLLKEVYNTLTEEEKQTLTDACKILSLRNHPVHLVKGEYTNLKITTPGDYLVAQGFIQAGIYSDQDEQ